MDSMIPPLFPENQDHLSTNDTRSHVDMSTSSAQVGIFSGRVKSSLSELSGFELALPDMAGLVIVAEEPRVLRNQNEFLTPSLETRPISPDNIISIPLKEVPVQSSGGSQDLTKKPKLVSREFNELLPYLEKIHTFCSKIDTKSLEDGISGIATILFYFVEGLDIFVTNKQYGLNNREAFIEMISGDVIPRSSKWGVNILYRDIQSTRIPRFKAFELEELGLQFIEYFSLYQELKNARNDSSETGIVLRKLWKFVMCAKVDTAEASMELFFQRRKRLFPDKTE